MMIYFDTNVLIYTVATQGDKKTEISNYLISKAIKRKEFFISELVLIELIFGLSKLKIENKEIVDLYYDLSKSMINNDIVISAFKKCKLLNKCRNINDFVHLEIVNRYCDKLITFDSDFKNLEKFYDIEIEILKD